MKACKDCNEYECGGQGSDGISVTCGTGGFTKFETGAVRDTGGKGRMDLIPWCAVIRISKHMEDALTHYPERNWEIGLPMHTMIDSAFRHLAKYVDGQTDEDHLCAAATNLLMAMWTEEKKPSLQDIPSLAPLGPSLASDAPDGQEYRAQSERKEDGTTDTEENGVCRYYSPYEGDPAYSVCNGTKEREQCFCGGDPNKCDFYAPYE